MAKQKYKCYNKICMKKNRNHFYETKIGREHLKFANETPNISIQEEREERYDRDAISRAFSKVELLMSKYENNREELYENKFLYNKFQREIDQICREENLNWDERYGLEEEFKIGRASCRERV